MNTEQMNETEFEELDDVEQLKTLYETGFPCAGAGYLRFFLMAFVCFWNFGFPEPTGFAAALSGFAAPAFFILSGFFVMTGNETERHERIVRKVKKCLKWFSIIFVCYLLLNIAVLLIKGISMRVTIRTVFNFVVLNLWPLPIGTNIWFIQALLYAYIVILIAEKLKILKYYKLVMVITMILMILFGELAQVIHFGFHGYYYIPGNWLTRALPYILLGMLMREKIGAILRIRAWIYIVMFIVGGGLAIGEIILLGNNGLLVYEGHMIGYGVMAFALCGFTISHPELPPSRITFHDTACSSLIYALMDPIFYIAGLVAGSSHLVLIAQFGGIGAWLVSILISLTALEVKMFVSTGGNKFDPYDYGEDDDDDDDF